MTPSFGSSPERFASSCWNGIVQQQLMSPQTRLSLRARCAVTNEGTVQDCPIVHWECDSIPDRPDLRPDERCAERNDVIVGDRPDGYDVSPSLREALMSMRRKLLLAALITSGASLWANDQLTVGVDTGRTGWFAVGLYLIRISEMRGYVTACSPLRCLPPQMT